jgi:DNA-binding LytR/AlgR family response regulator
MASIDCGRDVTAPGTTTLAATFPVAEAARCHLSLALIPAPDQISSVQNQPLPQTPTHAPHDQPVRPDTKPCENRTMAQRVLVYISRREQRVVDPGDVYCLVATGGETEVRMRGRTPLIDIHPLGEVLPFFEPVGFVRIHHQHAVNPAHVRLLRLQADGRDWEVKMSPPVNMVLPIARDRLGVVRGVLGGGG